jgi:catechol 2,3-dioxygenase-like lactoylglutathione lyase family enzyme
MKRSRRSAVRLDLNASPFVRRPFFGRHYARCVNWKEGRNAMSEKPETCGFNHVATATADLDRYLAFYEDIFGAQVLSITDAREDHPRMAIVDMGGDSALNVFEVPAGSILGDRRQMFGRGPIDHYALAVDSEDKLKEMRDRLVAVGASPGEITQFGPAVLSVFFRDPDGAELEVVYLKSARQ